MKGYKPAKKSIALIALGISALLVIGFALLLRADIRRPKALDETRWSESVPAGFAYEFTAAAEGGALELRGWACVEGERILTVESYVALYNPATGQYLRLPTVMEFNEGATQALGGGIVYDRGGFASITPLKYLGDGWAGYEVCFAYASNGHSFLAHTGVTLGEGGGTA